MTPRVISVFVITGLVLLTGGFVAGRYTTTPKVITTETVKVVEVEKQVVVTQKEVEVKIVRVVEKSTDKTKVTTTATGKDGATTTTTTEREHIDTRVVTDTEGKGKDTTVAQREAATQVDRTSVVKPVDNRPSWLVGAYAGGGFSGSNLIPGLPTWSVIGVSAEKRILGPIWGGAWGDSRGSLGLKLTVGL